MKAQLQRLCLAVALLALPPLAIAEEQPPKLSATSVPLDHIYFPKEVPKQTVFLVSNASGWGPEQEGQAEQLREAGAAVIGIDYTQYLSRLSEVDSSCIYMMSDIESLSHQIQRLTNVSTYQPPIIAGEGDGGALVLAMVAQSPQSTISQAIAVDPKQGIALDKILCTPASKSKNDGVTVYGLTDGALPAKVTVLLTAHAPSDGRSHVATLKAAHPDINVEESDSSAEMALSKALGATLTDDNESDDQLGLPITELPAQSQFDTLAVVYSGDGGWRDIDQEVAGELQNLGMPVVGIDALRYFWSKKTAGETAQDLAKVMNFYQAKWGTKNFILVGYSFGADILPASYNLLPENLRGAVRQISLLALSKQVDFEISVTGWLGAAGDGEAGNPVDDIAKIKPALVQCYYGEDETDDPCPTLAAKGVEVISTKGGHHFDGDYKAMAAKIVDGLQRRINGK